METTFDKFITNDCNQKALFDLEYAEFSHSENVLENLNKEWESKPVIRKRNTQPQIRAKHRFVESYFVD